MIEYFASVVLVCGGVLAVIWKLEDFVVKRSDKETSELLNQYYETVVKNRLKQIVKSKRDLKMGLVADLREDLNQPVNLNELRKTAAKYGRYSLWAIFFTALMAISNHAFPTFTLDDLSIYEILVMSGLATPFLIWSYYNALKELKDRIGGVEKRIQTSKSLDFE